MTTYLLPVKTNGKNLVLEYRLVIIKKDMRRRFCKENAAYIVDDIKLLNAVYHTQAKVKEDRIIMPDGKTAYKFAKELRGEI